MQSLEGIRVVTLAENYPGPFCTMLLADMGADVIKVERPGVGDAARVFNDHFVALNRNQRSVTLNMKNPDGMAICRQLVDKADVFVEGYRPGVAARLGLGYEELRKLNPRLVYCSISGFGQESPYLKNPAHDLSYAAMTGVLAPCIPLKDFTGLPSVAIGDVLSALYSTVGIMSALLMRESSGVGQYLDVSMADCMISLMATNIVQTLNGHGTISPDPSYGTYACSDGKYFTISIAHEDNFWRNMCGVLGWEDISALTLPERQARGEEIKRRLRAAMVTQPRDHWTAVMEAADVPAGPVLDLYEVAAGPQVVQRGLLQRVPEVDGTSQWAIIQPIKFSDTPSSIRRPWPRLGEHTDEVLAELGKSKQDIERLHREKAV